MQITGDYMGWRMRLGAMLLVWLGGLICAECFAADINGIRLWRAPDSTRLVLDLSGQVEHKVFTLKHPDRVVIDIQTVTLKASSKTLALKGTPINKMRFGKRGKAGLRLVLDMQRAVTPSSFSLKKHGGKPDRLVVDLLDGNVKPALVKAGPRPVAYKTQDIMDMVPAKRDVIIAVDAGHGGEDPGALGPRKLKLKEKHVVLAISKKLVNRINAEPGYKAFLVRKGDYYIPLRKRRNAARSKRADLFVSIHADAFKDSRAKGASVFALSRKGATSETARFLASTENKADLIGGVGGVDLSEVDDTVAGVLVDISMNATLSNSLNVGARVLREMGAITKLHKKHVEQAGFAVLKSPDVPSILVETGFISNPGEAKKLATNAFRSKVAGAVFRGVKAYFNDSPPAGSWIAWQKSQGKRARTEYVIASGDTLSGIAKRYNVQLNTLLKRNGLKRSAVIRVGQRLTIPAS